jgi:hypothetical protein
MTKINQNSLYFNLSENDQAGKTFNIFFPGGIFPLGQNIIDHR